MDELPLRVYLTCGAIVHKLREAIWILVFFEFYHGFDLVSILFSDQFISDVKSFYHQVILPTYISLCYFPCVIDYVRIINGSIAALIKVSEHFIAHSCLTNHYWAVLLEDFSLDLKKSFTGKVRILRDNVFILLHI
jgi:hypothetical protein